MNAETLKKLNELQQQIQALRRGVDAARRHTISYHVPGYDSYYTLPVKHVPGLEDGLKEWLIDQMEEHLTDLEVQMSNLTVCTKSNETRYDPTEL